MLNTHLLRQARKNGAFNHENRNNCDCSACETELINRKSYRIELCIGFILLVLAIMLVLAVGTAHASESHIDDSRAINAIIGEAENQGYQGMLAVACAIRNRGTLKGVYGENAPRVRGHRYSHKTYLNAQMAWLESTKKDITLGANHWENVKAFGLPVWADSCKTTVKVKEHQFFRC